MPSIVVHIPKLLPLIQLNPVAYNPRKISPEKFEALKENIRLEGFVEPIVVQKKGMNIIGGHQRYLAVKEMSVEACEQPPDLPCIVLDIDDDRAKKLNIKMNSLKGEFDANKLGELLIDIFEEPKMVTQEEAAFLGFTEEDVTKHMHLIEPPPPDMGPSDGEAPTFGKSVTLSLEFNSVDTRERVKKILAERTKLLRKKSGDVIASLLSPAKAKGAAKKKRA